MHAQYGHLICFLIVLKGMSPSPLERDKHVVPPFIHRILRSIRHTTMNDRDEQNGPFDNDHENQTDLGPDEHRNDERYSVRGPCAYELIEGEGKEAVVVHYGTAYSLNVSADGILLVLDRQPLIRQLLEVHNPSVTGRQAVTLFEVQWAKCLPTGSTTPRYLVGCRLSFGRFPYFLFQRGHLDHNLSGLSL